MPLCPEARRSGLPVPRRRTLAAVILTFARSMLAALRHPGSAGQQRRLRGTGNPELVKSSCERLQGVREASKKPGAQATGSA